MYDDDELWDTVLSVILTTVGAAAACALALFIAGTVTVIHFI